ncbi:MAG: hypothetical protein LRY40_03060 [Shewanella fodinae]|nr:hypothetical protein [Shewanella fodinae]
MNKQALTIVVCLCSWLLLSAFATASELVQRVFTARDGLGNSAIHDMATDDYGFVWLATEEGLYRVSNNVVRRVDNEETQSRLDEEFFVSVTKLDHQHLLAVTEHNAYLYDIRENAFHRFGSPQLFPEFDSWRADGHCCTA